MPFSSVNSLVSYLCPFRANSDAAAKAHSKLEYDQLAGKSDSQTIARVKRRYRSTLFEVEMVEEEIATFEDEHGITERWTPESEAYKAASDQLSVQTFREALTSLESLVVQRLLELTKLRMSGLCESSLSQPFPSSYNILCRL
jgi:hypothetical protein